MKKLKFDFRTLDDAQVLTREQLRTVVGGVDGSANNCNSQCTGSCTLAAPCAGHTGTCGFSSTLNKCFCTGAC